MHKELITTKTSQQKIIGIGSGTTITSLMEFLSPKSSYLPSSFKTHQNLLSHNLMVKTALDITNLDVYLDGADFYNERGDMIKGKGGCLLQEKFLMQISKETFIFVQKSKLRKSFDELKVPMDVLPMGVRILESEGANLRLCEGKFGPMITENGFFMMEISYSELYRVKDLACVICHGYFENEKCNYTIKELE